MTKRKSMSWEMEEWWEVHKDSDKRVLILLDLRSISEPKLEIQLLDGVIIEYLVSSIARKGCKEEALGRGLNSPPLVAVGLLVRDSWICPWSPNAGLRDDEETERCRGVFRRSARGEVRPGEVVSSDAGRERRSRLRWYDTGIRVRVSSRVEDEGGATRIWTSMVVRGFPAEARPLFEPGSISSVHVHVPAECLRRPELSSAEAAGVRSRRPHAASRPACSVLPRLVDDEPGDPRPAAAVFCRCPLPKLHGEEEGKPRGQSIYILRAGDKDRYMRIYGGNAKPRKSLRCNF